MSRAWSFALVVVVQVFAGRANAEERDACTSRAAAVVLRADVLDDALRSRFTQQLRAALATRSIELCTRDETSPSRSGPLARITLEATRTGDDVVALTVTVSDDLTNKRVARDVGLADVPADGRPLMLAQAADELLRASWAELLVRDAPPPTREVPVEVTEAIRPPTVPPVATEGPPRVEVFGAVGAEAFGSGQTQIGPDVIVGIFPFARFGALLRAGARTASSSETSLGAVAASAVVGAATAIASVLPRTGRIGLDAGIELFVTRARYEGRPAGDAIGRNDDATAVHLAIAPRTWIVIAGPLRVMLDVRAGLPLYGVRVVAAERSITGVRGVLVGAEVALGAAW